MTVYQITVLVGDSDTLGDAIAALSARNIGQFEVEILADGEGGQPASPKRVRFRDNPEEQAHWLENSPQTDIFFAKFAVGQLLMVEEFGALLEAGGWSKASASSCLSRLHITGHVRQAGRKRYERIK